VGENGDWLSEEQSLIGFLGCHAVKTLSRVKEVIEDKPKTSGVVKEKQREDNRKRDPHSKLLMDRQARESVQDEKAGHGNHHRRRIVHIDGTDKIALFPLELQTTVGTMAVHRERPAIQSAHAAARAFQTHPIADHRQNSMSHVRQSLLVEALARHRRLISLPHH